MNHFQPEPSSTVPALDSVNTIVVVDDGPGDTTVRPVRPALREQLERLRRRLFSSPAPSSTDAPKPENGSPSA